MFFLSSSLLCIALLCVLKVKGQTTQTVQVGLEGSFFDPSYVVAQVGDIISFVFSGNIHTVTQSTFENPCVALAGGFNSGLAGKGTNGTAPVPVWNLKVTNASAPIWYFCQATKPSSHCAAGMVGVINPPNVTVITQFVSAARAVSGTPVPSFGVVLSGVGAVATASPSDLSTMPPPVTSTASSSSSAPATTTVAPSSSGGTSNIGAIVGGVVGGILGLLLIFVALFWVVQQRKSKRRSVIPPSEDFGYTPKRPTNQSDFLAVRNTDPDIPNIRQADMGQMISRADTLSPLRRGGPSQTHTLVAPTPIRPQFALEHQHSFESDTQRSAAFSQRTLASEPPSNANIRSLAHEVAAVLLQTPGLGGAAGGGPRQYSHSRTGSNPDGESSGSRVQDGRRSEFHVENRDDREQDHGYQDMRPPPPHYRAAVGSSADRPLPREKGGLADRSL